MDSVYQAYPQRGTNGVSFTLTNIGESNKVVYLRDMTIYTLLRNIDHTNNCFSWIEERPISTIASHVTTDKGDTIKVITAENTNLSRCHVLCCLRIPPGAYTDIPSLVSTINDHLSNTMTSQSSKKTERRRLPCALNGIEYVQRTDASNRRPGFKFSISPDEQWWEKTGDTYEEPQSDQPVQDNQGDGATDGVDSTNGSNQPEGQADTQEGGQENEGGDGSGDSNTGDGGGDTESDKTETTKTEPKPIFVPTVRITPAVLQDPLYLSYDSSIKSTLYRNTILNGNQPPCVVMTKDSLYMPPLHEASVSLYNMNSKNVLSSNGSLTKQTIDFPSAISNKLGLQPFILPNNALFYTYDDAVRIYDNGFDYSEFLIDSYALDLQTLSNYYVNTVIYKGTPVAPTDAPSNRSGSTTQGGGTSDSGTGATGGSSEENPAEASVLAIPRGNTGNSAIAAGQVYRQEYVSLDQLPGKQVISGHTSGTMGGGQFVNEDKWQNAMNANAGANLQDKPSGEELKFYSHDDLYEYKSNYYAVVINRPGQTDVNYVANQPFFPPSNRLFVRSTRLGGIDSFVESQYRDERLIKNALAVIDLDPTAYVTTNGYTINETAIRPMKELTNELKIQHITVDINANMTIPPGQTQTIYITGSNQTYPLERGPHVLTYSIID